jgi:SOS-response transcriptional repressor LexA
VRCTLFTDMETFAAALRGQIKAKGWTAYRLAAESGITRGGLSLYLSGQRIPDDDSIAAIAQALGADRDELLGLADAQRIGAERLGRIARVMPAIDPPTPRLPFDAAAFDQLRELTDEGHAIAYYGRVGCGEFLQMCEVAQGVRNVPARFIDDPDDPMLGTVEAWGDSMTRAKIHEGMTLLVRCQNTAKPGQVVLADVPFAGTTCKRLVKEGRKLWLVAESSGSYPRIEVGPEVRIVGVVSAAWLAVEF